MATINETKPWPRYVMVDRYEDMYRIDGGLEMMIDEGFKRLKDGKMDAAFLRSANRLIVDKLGDDIDIVGDLGDIIITLKTGCFVNDFEQLKAIIGNDAAIITEEGVIDYDALVHLAGDADDTRAERVRQCITLADTVNVRWELHEDDNATRH